MLIVRVLGGLLLAASLVAGGADGLRSLERGEIKLQTIGDVWFDISPTGINLVQAIVERFVHPVAWDPAAVFFLQMPASIVLFGIGLLVLFWSSRPKPKAAVRHPASSGPQ
jgi:hypothetical protein